MPSEVEICSMALRLLGGEAITSFDDNTKRSNMCRDFYPSIRDAALRAYPWNCAKYRMALAQLAATPETGTDHDWAYQYPLPTNPYCLWVPKSLNEDLEYKIEGRNLLTDEATVTIIFIRRLEDTGLFDALLIQAIMARLASEFAYPITGQISLAREMWELYGAKLREARTIDGMEGSTDVVDATTLTDVRL